MFSDEQIDQALQDLLNRDKEAVESAKRALHEVIDEADGVMLYIILTLLKSFRDHGEAELNKRAKDN